MLGDRYGRRVVYIVTCFFVLCGSFLALSHSILSFAIIRSIVSFGVGGNITLDFVLLAEFLPSNRRGLYLFSMNGFWPIGQILTSGVAFAIIPHHGWRPFCLACALPSLITLLLRPCFPESPRWLLLQGRRAEATDVCVRIARAQGKDPETVGLSEGVQLDAETSSIPVKRSILAHLNSIFSLGLRPTTCGVLVMLTQCHVIGYFMILLPSLIDSKTQSHHNKYISMLGAGALGLAGVALAMLVSTLVGRLIPMKTCPLLLALGSMTFAFVEGEKAIFLCVSTIGFVLQFTYSLANTYIPEAYPTEIRASATGLIKSISKMIALGIPFCSTYVLCHFGHTGFCIVVSAFCLISSVGMWLFLQVETQGKHLEDRRNSLSSAPMLTELAES